MKCEVPYFYTETPKVEQASFSPVGFYSYPLKSGQGIYMDTAEISPKGIKGDRDFALIHQDKKGTMTTMTQRKFKKMAQIKTSITETGFVFSAPNMPNLEVTPTEEGESIQAIMTIAKDEVPTIHQGTTAAEWFTTFLGVDCSLVKMPDDYKRPVDVTYGSYEDQVSFADGFPILLTSTGSLAELHKIQADGEKTPMDRFRPNIVVDAPAFVEDTWKLIQIGEVIFKVCKPCLRCSITLKDQQTGETGKEPIQSLSKIRRAELSNGDTGVVFGQNLIPLNSGVIKKTDKVIILEAADESNFILIN